MEKRQSIPCKKIWVASNAWRGYRDFTNSVRCTGYSGERADSPNPKMAEIKAILEKIKQALKKQKIPCKVVGTGTSNVFTGGIDVLVFPSDVQRAKEIIQELDGLC